jgi:hypothetical protein
MQKPASSSIEKIKKSSESKLYLTEAPSELSLKKEYDITTQSLLINSKSEFYIMKYNLESILNELKSLTQRLKDTDEEEEQSLNW